MTDPNWNPKNYSFDFPDINIADGVLIIDTPIIYRAGQVLKYVSATIMEEIFRCLNTKAELAALILCLATIDYITGFYVGRATTSKHFQKFMNIYFPDPYKPYLEPIYYQLRCGLMHNLVSVHPWMKENIIFLIHPKSFDHLKIDSEGRVVFSVWHFATDIHRALVMYLFDMVMKPSEFPEYKEKFEKRFNRLGGIGSLLQRIPD